jgi:cobalamin biosynthesis Mg chelatase CobN
MNRRHFGLSIAAATFLTRQLREAIAQDASRSSSSADTDSTRRMRDQTGPSLTAGKSQQSLIGGDVADDNRRMRSGQRASPAGSRSPLTVLMAVAFLIFLLPSAHFGLPGMSRQNS